MCNANQDCTRCIDFMECSTDFMNYIHDVEIDEDMYPEEGER
jgi:hypothetical protein